MYSYRVRLHFVNKLLTVDLRFSIYFGRFFEDLSDQRALEKCHLISENILCDQMFGQLQLFDNQLRIKLKL